MDTLVALSILHQTCSDWQSLIRLKHNLTFSPLSLPSTNKSYLLSISLNMAQILLAMRAFFSLLLTRNTIFFYPQVLFANACPCGFASSFISSVLIYPCKSINTTTNTFASVIKIFLERWYTRNLRISRFFERISASFRYFFMKSCLLTIISYRFLVKSIKSFIMGVLVTLETRLKVPIFDTFDAFGHFSSCLFWPKLLAYCTHFLKTF